MHSNLVFNPPLSLNFGFPTKKATFQTIIHTPVSQRGEVRASLQPYPVWEIEYELDHARGDELDQDSVYQFLLGFSLAMGGQFSDFLFEDQTDNMATNAYFGLGDGETTNFQLVRQIGFGTDIVQNPVNDPPPVISINGIPTTAFTMGQNGIVQFDEAPADGVVLTWSGPYFFRVRFADDGLSFQAFMDRIWECQSIKLQSVIL